MFHSVFNDVLGPVMRGPSSSHTAGSYHIGLVVRELLGAEPKKIHISFDPAGSYGKTCVQQGVDQAFITGLMGWQQTDEIFTHALSSARSMGVEIDFEITKIPQANHPNFVILELEDQNGQSLLVEAQSVGGGTFRISKVDDGSLLLNGKCYETLLVTINSYRDWLLQYLQKIYPAGSANSTAINHDRTVIQFSTNTQLSKDVSAFLAADSRVEKIRQTSPVYYTQKGKALFHSATEMVRFCNEQKCSLGQALLAYETEILGIGEQQAISEMLRRYGVMHRSVEDGLKDDQVKMQLLQPTASKIMTKVKQNRVAIGGIHSLAAAAAMATMHTCNSKGVICAAPTGGAAGTLPGVLTALDEEFQITKQDPKKMALMLFAAGGIGLILSIRATFAAEVAGCQVEIGAAGAMAAAAVVEFAGGTANQACDAAAISFQNSMGSVCDLVQGMCEIPCHTRNAVAASSAFTNADMILGGYINPINLDETIDAVYSSGKMLPSELRCTALGGLALAPTAQTLGRC